MLPQYNSQLYILIILIHSLLVHKIETQYAFMLNVDKAKIYSK